MVPARKTPEQTTQQPRPEPPDKGGPVRARSPDAPGGAGAARRAGWSTALSQLEASLAGARADAGKARDAWEAGEARQAGQAGQAEVERHSE